MPVISPLTRDYDRSRFDCGVPELNAFLKSTARQHADKGISRTSVLSEADKPVLILGYITLTLCEVRTERLPERYGKKHPSHALPAVRRARLAVDRKARGQGYGGLLPADAIRRTIVVAEHAGSAGLFVDPKSEHAQRFYEKYGFLALRGHVPQLFLPIETLRAALPDGGF